MKTTTIPQPGTPDGRCPWICPHEACHEMSEQAGRFCLLCGEEIGFDRPFGVYPSDKMSVVHADCLKEERLR